MTQLGAFGIFKIPVDGGPRDDTGAELEHGCFAHQRTTPPPLHHQLWRGEEYQ